MPNNRFDRWVCALERRLLNLLDRHDSPFDLTFALRRATGGRWLNVGVLPAANGG